MAEKEYALVFDPERIELDDVIALEDIKLPSDMKHMLAKYMQNGDGEYLPEEEALEELGHFSIRQIGEGFRAFQTLVANEITGSVGPKGKR
jgi:hypothetical protein